ncbi:MAG: MarR family winged helix-turn-helix transcriptional regulator [Actinomycetota bacterium]
MTSTESIAAVRALARASRLIERASDSLSLADYRVLSAIVEGEARASRLAARLAVGRPTISASVDSLCRRGLLEKGQVAGDGRASDLSLTREGAAVFEAAESAMVARREALCAGIPEARAAMATLSRLGDAIDAAMIEREVRA